MFFHYIVEDKEEAQGVISEETPFQALGKTSMLIHGLVIHQDHIIPGRTAKQRPFTPALVFLSVSQRVAFNQTFT